MSGSSQGLREAILAVLCDAAEPLTFEEILERLRGVLGEYPRKIDAREALARLIREGSVAREPGYERRRMVFRPKTPCTQHGRDG